MEYIIEKVNLRVKSELFRKLTTMDFIDEISIAERNRRYYDVDYIVRMKEEHYTKFTNDLLKDYEFIEELNELTSLPFIVTVEDNNDFTEKSILVSHEGYSYARYSGLIFDTIR